METAIVKPEGQTSLLAKKDELKQLIEKAPQALEENTRSKSRALEAGRKLLDQAKELGMNPQLDELIAEFIKKGKITLKNMNDKRVPFTQMMTMAAKEFTGLENQVKDIVDEAQRIRNDFAEKVMKERQEAERLAALKLAKDNEKIEIEKNYRIAHSEKYTDYLLTFKTSKMNWFNDLSLDTIDLAELEINKFLNGISDSSFVYEILPQTAKYHTPEEVRAIFGKIAMSLTYNSMSDFKSNIAIFQRELIDLIPTKKNQLLEAKVIADRIASEKAEAERKRLAAEDERKRIEESAKLEQEKADKLKLAHDRYVYASTGYIPQTDISYIEQIKEIGCKSIDVVEYEYKTIRDELTVNPVLMALAKNIENAEIQRIASEKVEAERKRLAAEQAEAERIRKEEESEKLRKEAEKKQQDAQAEASVSAAGQTASAFVDSQATLFDEAPKVKEAYSIKVLNPAAYLLIIQFWFEKEGRNLPMDRIEGKSIAQMKAFCEKHAIKTDELIVSPLLKYEPVYKAK